MEMNNTARSGALCRTCEYALWK